MNTPAPLWYRLFLSTPLSQRCRVGDRLDTVPWEWLWAYLIAINTATLALYGYDKAVAGSGGRRVPEIVLHGAELLGGTPAAFVAQRLLHHKSRKGSYQMRFWLIVAMQAAAVLVIWQIGWV